MEAETIMEVHAHSSCSFCRVCAAALLSDKDDGDSDGNGDEDASCSKPWCTTPHERHMPLSQEVYRARPAVWAILFVGGRVKA